MVELATSLEEQFGFKIDDSDFTGEVFETVGTLAEFVRKNSGSGQGKSGERKVAASAACKLHQAAQRHQRVLERLLTFIARCLRTLTSTVRPPYDHCEQLEV